MTMNISSTVMENTAAARATITTFDAIHHRFRISDYFVGTPTPTIGFRKQYGTTTFCRLLIPRHSKAVFCRSLGLTRQMDDPCRLPTNKGLDITSFKKKVW